MTRLGLLVLVAALGACSPYVKQDSSAAAGASAHPEAPLLVRVIPDNGDKKEQVLPTAYPDFHPNDRVRILKDGTVVPLQQ